MSAPHAATINSNNFFAARIPAKSQKDWLSWRCPPIVGFAIQCGGIAPIFAELIVLYVLETTKGFPSRASADV
jgi:hypothetical protein